MLLNFNLVLQSYKILKFSEYLKASTQKMFNNIGVLDPLI